MENRITKLRGYRTMLDLTQQDMAELLGISRRTYQDKEAGTSKLSLTEAIKIVEEFEKRGLSVSVAEFV
mgnify:CR=1 FL=1